MYVLLAAPILALAVLVPTHGGDYTHDGCDPASTTPSACNPADDTPSEFTMYDDDPARGKKRCRDALAQSPRGSTCRVESTRDFEDMG